MMKYQDNLNMFLKRIAVFFSRGCFLLLLPFQFYRSLPYIAQTTGYDISFPQCPTDFPQVPFRFGIVGVSAGKAFTQNRCLLAEFLWARRQGKIPSVYMNLNYPSGTTATFGRSGPLGICGQGDLSCNAYNYGYNAAQFSYLYASSQVVRAPIWWIDIELTNTWADTFSLNAKVLEGTLAFFSEYHVQAGIYSTSRDWRGIMEKTFIPRENLVPVPSWRGGATEETKERFCLGSFIPESPISIVQYIHDAFDVNYTCL